MGTIDIVLLALFIPGLILGFAKGIIMQVVSLVSLIVGAVVASRFAQEVADVALLQFSGVDGKVMYVICFALLFLACVLVMMLVGKLITRLFKAATLGWINRLLGALFSLFITAFALGFLISVFEGLNESWNIVDPEQFADLKVWPALRDFSGWILPQLKLFISDQMAPAAAAEQCTSV